MSPRPTLLLLHGSVSSAAQWRPLREALSSAWRIHAPDLSGYGAAPMPEQPRPFTFAAEAAPVARWLAEVESPVHVVAHSYGAAVALHLSRAMPQRIASLLVYEPAAFHLLRGGGSEDQRGWDEIGAVARRVREAVGRGDLDAGASAFVDYWNGTGAWSRLPFSVRSAVLQSLPKVVLDFEAAMDDPMRPDDLRGSRIPRLLVQGERSPLAARRVAARLAGAWGGAGLVVMADAGHMGPVTHREAFQAVVERHLAGCVES